MRATAHAEGARDIGGRLLPFVLVDVDVRRRRWRRRERHRGEGWPAIRQVIRPERRLDSQAGGNDIALRPT
jgi:hypothetical protein